MPAPIIQAQYEILDDIAGRFQRQSELTTQQAERLRRVVEGLQDGGWVGRGAKSFFDEMEKDVMPAVQRLIYALSQAQSTTLQIAQILREAEEEAALPFMRGAGESFTDSTSSDTPAGPPFGDYDRLDSIPPLVLGPGATYQDLAAVLEQMYRINNYKDGRKYGIDEPIKIVKIGNNEYLVLVAGTDADDDVVGANDWPSAVITGLGVPTRYQLQVQRLIEEKIPEGATIHLAGHSQGGHVVLDLAGTQSLVDHYHIGSVTTFGSSGNTPYNPRVGAENYHAFLFPDDPLQAHEVAKEFVASLSNGSLDDVTIDPINIPENGGHSGYFRSDYLAQRSLPFTINQWEVVGSYKASEYDSSRIAFDQMMQGIKSKDYTRAFWGGVDLVGRYSGAFVLAGAQSVTSNVTRFLPEPIQTSIDRVFDEAGRKLAEAPPLSRKITDAVGAVWSGFWN